MVQSYSSPVEEEGLLVYDKKLSSVGPGTPTPTDSVFEPENVDLAMKLHYIRFIYYFGREAFEGLPILGIKEPIFTWTNQFPVTSGRFRRSDSGRPYIKCNDCGMRFIETKCPKTLDEWMMIKDDSMEKSLVPDQTIGPELFFSPIVTFKCGGSALGVSWTHVLGDGFSLAEFMNHWGYAVSGHEPGRPVDLPLSLTKPTSTNGSQAENLEDPVSLKRVGPVGDNWVNVTKHKMVEFSFNISAETMSHLESNVSGTDKVSTFEKLSGVIWRSIARIRGNESEPKTVTICRKCEQDKAHEVLNNNQVVSVVRADFPIHDANTYVLATLIKNGAVDERKKIHEVMEKEQGIPDFILYGANLTFVNFDDGSFYGFEHRGQKPLGFSLRIDGIGEEGAVFVLPLADDHQGRKITAILPEHELVDFKTEQIKEQGLYVLCVFDHNNSH